MSASSRILIRTLFSTKSINQNLILTVIKPLARHRYHHSIYPFSLSRPGIPTSFGFNRHLSDITHQNTTMSTQEPTSTSSSSASPSEVDTSKFSVWYVPGENLKLTPYADRLFQEYCGIPADQVSSHIIAVRERAWKIYPYPCIGNFRFLDFIITSSPAFPTVLSKLQGGGKFLDLGCCFAQDLRALAYAGAPSENLYGADLKLEYIDLGYELFKDKDSFKGTFVQGDIFDPSAFSDLKGSMNVVSARSFMHLFPPEKELEAAIKIVGLLKDEQGTIIMGRQVGTKRPGLHNFALDKEMVWRHDPDTFKEFWNRVGEKTGTKWRVEAKLIELEDKQREVMRHVEVEDVGNRAWLEFVVTRT